METKVKPERSVAPSAQTEALTTQTESSMVASNSETDEKWRQVGQQIGTQTAAFLERLPEYFSRFFKQYQGAIATIGLIVATIIGFRVLLAVMDVLNDIPLLAPSLELIGISFTGWFVYRYLLKSSTRQELAGEIQRIKEQFLG